MPDIGEGIAEVELVHWYVKPGDVVAEEQVLADVMTDKANVEIPSNVAGKVISITGKPGDVVAVGSEIIRLEVEGKGNVAEGAAAPAPKAAAASSSRPLQSSDGPGSNLKAQPAELGPRASAATAAPGATKVAPPPPKPAPALHAVPPPSSSPPPPPASNNDRPLAAPAVRRRARELGIDLARVNGSGPDGRVTQDDL